MALAAVINADARVASLLSAGAEPDKAGYAVLGNPN